jgi:hypothetical protein
MPSHLYFLQLLQITMDYSRLPFLHVTLPAMIPEALAKILDALKTLLVKILETTLVAIGVAKILEAVKTLLLVKILETALVAIRVAKI